MDEDEKMFIIAQYINSIGAWPDFEEYIAVAGYTLQEMGFAEEWIDNEN